MTWTLPEEAFLCLERRFPAGAHLLELGSGEGTRRLGRRFQVTSVEHDPYWAGYMDGPAMIFAPIKDGWYDTNVLRSQLPASYDGLIVDGPPASIGRYPLLKHLDLFLEVPILIDDVHRAFDRRLALALAKARRRELKIYRSADRRAFATIGW